MRNQDGFTTVELIIVMVIGGILAAMAIGRFFDRGSFDAAAFADQSRALLRYAQKAAIARNSPIFVQLDEQRISLCYQRPQAGCALDSRVPYPGGGLGDPASDTHCQDERWYCIGLPKDVALSLPLGITELSFDALGRPTVQDGKFDGLTMTITGAGDTHTVAVHGETGYVP